MSHPPDTLSGMNVTQIPTADPLEMALAALREAGFEFTLVCEGPETACDDVPAAA